MVTGSNDQPNDRGWPGRWKHMHACSSTYHAALLDTPHCLRLFYTANHVPMTACSCTSFLFFVRLLVLKTDKCPSLLRPGSPCSGTATASRLANRTAELCATQTTHDAIGTPAATFKIQTHIRIILTFFEKHKCSSIDFLSRAPDMFLTSSHV